MVVRCKLAQKTGKRALEEPQRCHGHILGSQHGCFIEYALSLVVLSCTRDTLPARAIPGGLVAADDYSISIM